MDRTVPLVGIVMGSDSDLPIVSKACQVLEELQIPFELNVISAHRTPDVAAQWAKTALERGLKVVIGAAGLAAHLPGVLAAHTSLPVIGLPISGGALKGTDALYSIVQMPSGIPVATVGIDNGKNAGLLAAQILATASPDIGEKLIGLRQRQAEDVVKKREKLSELGWRKYLESGK